MLALEALDWSVMPSTATSATTTTPCLYPPLTWADLELELDGLDWPDGQCCDWQGCYSTLAWCDHSFHTTVTDPYGRVTDTSHDRREFGSRGTFRGVDITTNDYHY